MFDDFSKKSDQDGKRFGVSLVAAAVIFGVFGGGMVAATAAVKTQQAEEELVQVEFAPPPEPEPPPPEPEPEPPPPEPEPQREPPENARQRVQRDELIQPEDISDEELEESDDELVDAENTGSQGGFLDGVEDGTGNQPAPPPPPPPPPPPEPRRPRGPVMRPERAIGGDTIERPSSLEYPQEAQSAGIQGVVIVKCVIDLQGRPKNCESLRGHDALVPAAIRFAERHRFSPVRLPDGTPIEVYKVIPVRFRLTNM